MLISKMEWARMSESARQIEDAARLLRVRSRHLDEIYVEHWVHELGLGEQWAAVRRAAFPPETEPGA